MIKTLKKKIIVTAMIAVTVLLAVLLGALNVVNAWSSRQDAERLLNSLVQMEAGTRRDQHRPDQPEGPGDWIPEPPEDGMEPPELPDGEGPGKGGFLSGDLTENDRLAAVYVTVRVKDGAVVSADVSRISSVTEDEAGAMARAVLQEGRTEGTLDGFRYASARNEEGQTVYVFLDDSSRSTSVLRVAVLSALAGLGGWLLMLLLVILLSKKAVAPIAANMDRQRQFVTDAGHELKTPLAIIQANTEAMELITGENKWSRNIKSQVVRMTDLTRNLLTLARAEEPPPEGSFAPVNFSELAGQTVKMFSANAELRGLRLETDLEPGLVLRGERTQLTNLLSILCDNAVKYAADGSEIRMQLKRADKDICLRLENKCETLPDCPPDRLFDRFYRVDSARTQSSGGFGIGLSAARVIAVRHGGTLEASYPGDDRIAFNVTLPAAAEEAP